MQIVDFQPSFIFVLSLTVGACGGSGSTDDTSTLAEQTSAADASVSSPQNTPEESESDPQTTVSQVVNGYVLVRRERFRLDGTLYFADEFEHDFANNRIVRTTSFREGDDDLRPFTHSSYDEAGNRTYVEDADTSLSFAGRREFLYDAEGFLTTENGYLLSNGSQYAAIDYRYHPDGRLEGKRDPDSDGGRRLVTVYNDQNQLISTTLDFPGSPGNIISTDLFEYEPGTDLIRRAETVDQAGRSISGYVLYDYDTERNMIGIERFDASGTPTSTDRFIYEQSPEPVYNFWLHTMRFFPEDARVAP